MIKPSDKLKEFTRLTGIKDPRIDAIVDSCENPDRLHSLTPAPPITTIEVDYGQMPNLVFDYHIPKQQPRRSEHYQKISSKPRGVGKLTGTTGWEL